MSKKMTRILVATTTLTGPRTGEGDARHELQTGEELTQEVQKALGLKKADVEDLTARGLLKEVSARTADVPGAAALAAMTERAEKAEARVAELEAAVAELEEQLADTIEVDEDGNPIAPDESAAAEKTGK